MSETPRTENGRFLQAGLEALGFAEDDAAERILAIETEAIELADPKGIGRAITAHGGKAVETIRAEAIEAAAARVAGLREAAQRMVDAYRDIEGDVINGRTESAWMQLGVELAALAAIREKS